VWAVPLGLWSIAPGASVHSAALNWLDIVKSNELLGRSESGDPVSSVAAACSASVTRSGSGRPRPAAGEVDSAEIGGVDPVLSTRDGYAATSGTARQRRSSVVHQAVHQEWSWGRLGGTVLSVSEQELLGALRRGDEQAFITLVDTHGASMLRLARVYVRDRAVAEEVVQEAWLGVLRGLERFEGRSSLRTWLLRIVANLARTRAVREARSIPFSALAGAELDAEGPSVPPERFRGPQDRWAGHWATPPEPWNRPEHELLSAETRAQIVVAIDALPERQRRVITLRDVEGCSAAEVCNVLELSETNQRVLLHRARTKVRQALDDYLTTSQHQASR
jgi:RNA polymerase sigma-70 factor, ECF subfamily